MLEKSFLVEETCFGQCNCADRLHCFGVVVLYVPWGLYYMLDIYLTPCVDVYEIVGYDVMLWLCDLKICDVTHTDLCLMI